MSVGFGHIFAYFVYYYFPFSDNRAVFFVSSFSYSVLFVEYL